MCTIGDFQHDVSPFIEVVIIWEIVQKSSKMFEEFLEELSSMSSYKNSSQNAFNLDIQKIAFFNNFEAFFRIRQHLLTKINRVKRSA